MRSSTGTTMTIDANKSGFSKTARGNQKSDEFIGQTSGQLQERLEKLSGRLDKAQKAEKQKLIKELKAKTDRNTQKKVVKKM